MRMSYEEAKEKMAQGLILACPHDGCLTALKFDKKNKTGSCDKHGIIVGLTYKLTSPPRGQKVRVNDRFNQ